MKMEVVRPLEFSALKLVFHFYHIMLVKASHKTSLDSTGRKTDSASQMKGPSDNLWNVYLYHTLLVRNLQMPYLVVAPVAWVTVVGRIVTPQRFLLPNT